MLVAPTEPPTIKQLGKSSAVPELFGVDIMFGSRIGTVGVQRKEINDFVASVKDGRLAREFPLMKQLHRAYLVIEGDLEQQSEHGQQWSIEQLRSYMFSVNEHGVHTATTDHAVDTVAFCRQLESWANKRTHTSLLTRPNPVGAWGTPDSRDWQLHVAQSFPGIGVVQAQRIIDHFGGTVPIGWTCSKEELGEVPGIGKGRLQKLWDALHEGETE